MRFIEITSLLPAPKDYPYVVFAIISPVLWDSFLHYVGIASSEFRLLSAAKPWTTNWLAYVGCASDTAKNEFTATWN